MSNHNRYPLISNIKRLSIDDGPGLRDVVFIKGCTMRCTWCHNPESIEDAISIRFSEETCIGCGECRVVCKTQAIHLNNPDRIHRDLCTRCGACVEVCPSRALETIGVEYSEAALASALLKDKLFFDNSGGGVTFSGGEPTYHMTYLKTVLEMLKLNGVSTAIQTNGDFDLAQFRQSILPYVDLVFFDIKIADPNLHKKMTGIGNERILFNLTSLASLQVPLIPRTPLVPDCTDTEENLSKINELLNRSKINGWIRLPFNPAFKNKWKSLALSRL